jgi:hypothetical protein
LADCGKLRFQSLDFKVQLNPPVELFFLAGPRAQDREFSTQADVVIEACPQGGSLF